MKKTAVFMAVLMAGIMVMSGCKDKDTKSKTDMDPENEAVTETARPKMSEELKELTENTIDGVLTLSNGDTIEFELYPDLAPKTVANFVKNVQEGFYSGTIFHRAVEGFVIQGGGYDENYKLKSVSETVEGEFESNGVENDLSHTRGVISMARTSEPDSASTQFFIVQEDSDYLDGEYAAFGRVTGGMEVVDEIAEAPKMKDPPAGMKEAPEEMYVIESINIDTAESSAEEAADADKKAEEKETDKPDSVKDAIDDMNKKINE